MAKAKPTKRIASKVVKKPARAKPAKPKPATRTARQSQSKAPAPSTKSSGATKAPGSSRATTGPATSTRSSRPTTGAEAAARYAATPSAIAAAEGAARYAAKPAAAPSGVAGELLAQILAAPDDPAPRAVYADALVEAGDPRGAFIAAQTALTELDPLDERYAPALAAVNRTIARHGNAWLGDYLTRTKIAEAAYRSPMDRLGNARFERGFLRRIAMLPEHVEREWPALRAREPLAGIELIVGEGIARDYARRTEPRAFRVLKVSPQGWFTSNSVAQVLAAGMPELRALDLSGCDLGTTGAQLLANQPTDLGASFDDHVDPPPFEPGQLRELVLHATQLGDAGARLVFAAEHLAELTALDLGQCRLVDDATLTALRDAPAMRKLRRLNLAGNALGERLGALAGWEVLPRLQQLGLPQTATADVLAALFPRPSETLRTLVLASGKAIAQAPNLFAVAAALVELDLGTTSLGDERWRELLAAPSARRLVHLHANGCSLSDAAVGALVRSPLDRLVTLDLSSNKLTDAGLAELAAWPGLQHVTHLRIGNNRKLTAAGLGALAASEVFEPAVLDVGKLAGAEALRERFGDAVVARG